MKKTALISTLLMLFPSIAFAQSLSNVQILVNAIGVIARTLVPILMVIAMLAFFWGLIRYIWGSQGEASKVDGKKIMIAGLVSLFIMACVWGIVILAANSLGVSTGASAITPGIPN